MENNDVKIGKQDFRFYIGQCAVKLRVNDQITLSSSDSFKEKLFWVIEGLAGLGVEVEKKYKNGSGKIQFTSDVCQIEDEKTGRMMNKIVHKVGLTKIPELFMYTDSNKEIPIPEIVEED